MVQMGALEPVRPLVVGLPSLGEVLWRSPPGYRILDDDGSSDPALVTVLTRAGFECSAASAEGTAVVRAQVRARPGGGALFRHEVHGKRDLSTIHHALQATIDRRVVEQAMSDQPTLGQPTIERAVPHRHKAGLTSPRVAGARALGGWPAQ